MYVLEWVEQKSRHEKKRKKMKRLVQKYAVHAIFRAEFSSMCLVQPCHSFDYIQLRWIPLPLNSLSCLFLWLVCLCVCCTQCILTYPMRHLRFSNVFLSQLVRLCSLIRHSHRCRCCRKCSSVFRSVLTFIHVFNDLDGAPNIHQRRKKKTNTQNEEKLHDIKLFSNEKNPTKE